MAYTVSSKGIAYGYESSNLSTPTKIISCRGRVVRQVVATHLYPSSNLGGMSNMMRYSSTDRAPGSELGDVGSIPTTAAKFNMALSSIWLGCVALNHTKRGSIPARATKSYAKTKSYVEI